MMAVTFSKKETEQNSFELSISDFGMIPIITHFDRSFRNTKVYPLHLYTEELMDNHALRNDGNGLSMDFFYTVLDRLNTKIIMHNPYLRNPYANNRQ